MAEDHSSVNYAQLSLQRAKCSITVIPLRIIVGREPLFKRALRSRQCPGVRKSIANISHRIYIKSHVDLIVNS